MGAEILAVLKVVEVVSNVFEGAAKDDAKRKEAKAVRQEADIEKEDALKAADIAKEEGERFLAEQALGFSASGVKLAGSPLEVLEETRTGIETEFQERGTRAEKVRGLRETQASRLEKSGQGDLIKGIVGGAAAFVA